MEEGADSNCDDAAMIRPAIHITTASQWYPNNRRRSSKTVSKAENTTRPPLKMKANDKEVHGSPYVDNTVDIMSAVEGTATNYIARHPYDSFGTCFMR